MYIWENTCHTLFQSQSEYLLLTYSWLQMKLNQWSLVPTVNIHYTEGTKNKHNCLVVFLNFHITTCIPSKYFSSQKEKKKKKRRRKRIKKLQVKGAYSYVIRIRASKLSKTTHTKEEILKAIPCMLFRECPPSHIFFLAYINNQTISCMMVGKTRLSIVFMNRKQLYLTKNP